jgi:uncharacterized protein
MMKNYLFRSWLGIALAVWLVLAYNYLDASFYLEHWYYPFTMVFGAFVAGFTPEGGGAVAFPILNIFLQIDRVLARDFSLMIQSIGMTSASIFILTSKTTDLTSFKPLLWWIPVTFCGFLFGILFLQNIKVVIIQALFLSLIASFSVTYFLATHRGTRDFYRPKSIVDTTYTVTVLIVGGMCTSLFGTGCDILIYTLLVTHFAMKEKTATQMGIILVTTISIAGFAYRGLFEGAITEYQVKTWLTAYPVVLIMAPLGAYALRRINKEHMLRAILVLNLLQLAYFNFYNPALSKTLWSLGATAFLSTVFYLGMSELSKRQTVASETDSSSSLL